MDDDGVERDGDGDGIERDGDGDGVERDGDGVERGMVKKECGSAKT
jgi:hypothetical protein